MNSIWLMSQIAWDWGLRAFGAQHMNDPQKRALRFGEEAVETMQALLVPREQAHLLVEVVYNRPVGTIGRELGGSMVTLLVLCRCLGKDPEELLYYEVQRVLAKPPEHFAQRNQEKNELGL